MASDNGTTRIIVGVISLAMLWLALTGWSWPAFWFGVPAVAITLVIALALVPAVSVSMVELVRLVPFFLQRSVIGAVDVTRRVLHPACPIDPGVVDYPLELPKGLAQTVMVTIVNLLPGTLVTRLENNVMSVHVVDVAADNIGEMNLIQQRLQRLLPVAEPSP